MQKLIILVGASITESDSAVGLHFQIGSGKASIAGYLEKEASVFRELLGV